MKTVLLVNHHLSEVCGVYQFGKLVEKILAKSERHRFIGVEANSVEELAHKLNDLGTVIDVIIYNYHPGVLGWATEAARFIRDTIHIGTVHEGSPVTGWPGNEFPFWVWHDPSVIGWKGKPDNIFGVVRPLPKCIEGDENPTLGWYGTFGFPIAAKGYEDVIRKAAEDRKCLECIWPDCWYFGTEVSTNNRNSLIALADGLGVKTLVQRHFLDDEIVVGRLAQNGANLLLYPNNPGRGISSSLDFLIAAGRPMILSDSTQFRHVHHFYGYDGIDHPVPKIATYDPLPLQKAWSNEVLISQYEDVVDAVTKGVCA